MEFLLRNVGALIWIKSLQTRRGYPTGMDILTYLLLGLIAGLIGFRILDNHGKGFWHYIALALVGVIFGAMLFGNL
jgi:hypothetical protein